MSSIGTEKGNIIKRFKMSNTPETFALGYCAKDDCPFQRNQARGRGLYCNLHADDSGASIPRY
jgi:hypothetical protein